MSIQNQVLLSDSISQLTFAGSSRYTPESDAFVANSIEVLNVDEVPSLGDIITPRNVAVRLLSGDDLLVGFDGSNYPFRLTIPPNGVGEAILLRLDVEGLREVSQIVCNADAGDLGGTYFDLEDRNSVVRVWFDMPGAAAVSTVECVADVAGSLHEKYFVMQDAAGNVGVWFDVDNAGGTAPAGAIACDRQIEISTVVTGDTADAVATAVKNALDADAAFTATVLTDTVTVTDVAIGDRGTFSAGDSGFTVTETTIGYDTSTPPDDDPERLLPVVIAFGDSAATVAAAVAAAIDADAEFSAVADDDTVTVTDAHTGSRAAAVDGSTSFAITTVQAGADSPVIHLKSTGTSQVLFSASPN